LAGGNIVMAGPILGVKITFCHCDCDLCNKNGSKGGQPINYYLEIDGGADDCFVGKFLCRKCLIAFNEAVGTAIPCEGDYFAENGDILIPPEVIENECVRVIRHGRVLRNGVDFNAPPLLSVRDRIKRFLKQVAKAEKAV
jgi:hypothetical protein